MTAAQFRRLALDLPDTIESSHCAHPDFRVDPPAAFPAARRSAKSTSSAAKRQDIPRGRSSSDLSPRGGESTRVAESR